MVGAIGIVGRVGTVALSLLGELVAPTRCAACDGAVQNRSVFCAGCASTVERAPLAAEHGSADYVAAFEYGGAVANAIGRLKYEERSDLAPRLARAMEQAARTFDGSVDLVVPVPLHPRRLAQRGYNQAALLAGPIARVLGVPVRTRALVRVRDTPQQVAMDRERRQTNMREAFEAHDRRLASGKSILLVDDVRTTGATLDGCVRALHEVGARRIVALVLARRA